MDVKIDSKSVEVITSGTIIAFRAEPIKISFGPPTDRLNIIIAFTSEGIQVTKPGVRSEILDPHTLQLTFINIKAEMGYGTQKPFSIGTIEGKQVYMHYRIYDLGGASDKIFHYSFYRSKE
ncbi:MAG: DUF6864 domain-containing function [Thermodesulfobacteriota bacterium]|jgi:hypothetical protein